MSDKYGIRDISLAEYRKLGMVDLVDDVIAGFEEHSALRGMSSQHIQALLDGVIGMRNILAKRAGVQQSQVRRWKRK